MSIIAITDPNKSDADIPILCEMHRRRARILWGRVTPNVHSVVSLEIDQFVESRPIYIRCLVRTQTSRLCVATTANIPREQGGLHSAIHVMLAGRRQADWRSFDLFRPNDYSSNFESLEGEAARP